MTTRRAQSADRGLPTDTDAFRQMSDVLGQIWETQQTQQQKILQPPRPRQYFKAPEYNGTGDVEFFVTQFGEVAEANEWTAIASLLHLREALKEGAKDCGRAGNLAGVFTALRARYGLTPREARARISTLRKDNRASLQEHATEVDRLCQIAYIELPDRYRASMSLETFCNTLGNTYLQRHLLAIQAVTLEQAVRAGNEFLQIRAPILPGSAIRAVDEDEQVEDQVASIEQSVLSKLLKNMQILSDKVDRLQTTPKPAATKQIAKSTGCWGCGQEGHTRRACLTNPWPTKPTTSTQSQGNGSSPQQ